MVVNKWDLRDRRKVPDDWLIEELMRRRNAEPVAAPAHWCHDCAHFEAWNERPRQGECPDDFNPCTKAHAMKFVMPQDFGDEHGFYRRVCPDRDMPQIATDPPRHIKPRPSLPKPRIVRKETPP